MEFLKKIFPKMSIIDLDCLYILVNHFSQLFVISLLNVFILAGRQGNNLCTLKDVASAGYPFLFKNIHMLARLEPCI